MAVREYAPYIVDMPLVASREFLFNGHRYKYGEAFEDVDCDPRKRELLYKARKLRVKPLTIVDKIVKKVAAVVKPWDKETEE